MPVSPSDRVEHPRHDRPDTRRQWIPRIEIEMMQLQALAMVARRDDEHPDKRMKVEAGHFDGYANDLLEALLDGQPPTKANLFLAAARQTAEVASRNREWIAKREQQRKAKKRRKRPGDG